MIILKQAIMVNLRIQRDKGRAWLILAVTFTGVLIEGSILHSPQLYVLQYKNTFNTSSSIVGLPGGVHAGIHDLAALPSSVFVNKFGCKICGIIAGILISAGLFLSAFAPNIYFLIGSYGVIASVGSSMIFLVSLVMTHEYFDKYKGFASSVFMSGYAVNFIVFVPLLQLIIDEYGWRGSHAIHAAFVANFIAFSLLFHKQVPDNGRVKGGSNIDLSEKSCHKKGPDSLDTSRLEDIHTDCESSLPKEDGLKTIILKELYKALDVSLFKNTHYVLFLISCGFATYMDELIMKVFVSFMDEKGISTLNATYVVSVLGISSLVFKILFGLIATCKCTNVILLKGTCVILMGVFVVMFTYVDKYYLVVAASFMIGVFMAGIYAVKVYVLDIIVGTDRIAVAFGWIFVVQSISATSCLPLSGLMYDLTGSWTLAFIVGCVSGFFGGFILILISYLHWQKTNQSQ